MPFAGKELHPEPMVYSAHKFPDLTEGLVHMLATDYRKQLYGNYIAEQFRLTNLQFCFHDKILFLQCFQNVFTMFSRIL